MATEFEAKVLLTAEEFVEILTKHDSYMMPKIVKEDSYWSKYASSKEAVKNNESLTRIRGENGHYFLTLKKKYKDEGFEDNKEFETRIEKPEVIKKLLMESGYKCVFKKYKTSWRLPDHHEIAVNNVDVHIELEIVENTKDKNSKNYKYYYALEIECIPHESTIIFTNDYLSALIKNAFAIFNKTEKNFETRSWQELLA